jgi:hypothetical protein
VSDSRHCAWIASPSAAPADEIGYRSVIFVESLPLR